MEKLVVTENDVEFEYFDRLEQPVLACQGLSLPFSAVFCNNGCEKSGGTRQDRTAFLSMSVYGF